MASDFKLNTRNIAKMAQEIQREFDKHPVSIPVQAEQQGLPAGNTVVYNGPVITMNGNHAQLAWKSQNVVQNQAQQEIASGYEPLAEALVRTLEGLSAIGLTEDDRATAEESARTVLAQITGPQQDPGVIRRGVATVKGVLATLALGASTGAGAGVHEWAKTAVEQLTAAMT